MSSVMKFCYVRKKEGHKPAEEQHDETIGDQYCFVAMLAVM